MQLLCVSLMLNSLVHTNTPGDTSCLKMWVRVVLECGYELSQNVGTSCLTMWVRVVSSLGTGCLGYGMSWVRVI